MTLGPWEAWPKGERRLSAVGIPERTFTSALPNGSTREELRTPFGVRKSPKNEPAVWV